MSDTLSAEGLDAEIVRDFLDGLKDELEEIERDLLLLEKHPNDQEALNALFRAVHSIKGNARMCMLEPISDCVHDMEEALSEVRAGRLNFTALLGEAVLLTLDQLKIRSEDLVRKGEMDLSLLNKVRPYFAKICKAMPMDAEYLASEIINFIGGGAVASIPLKSQASSSTHDASQANCDQNDTIDEETFEYFQELADVIDAKCPFWEKRTGQQVEIALGVNEYLKTTVEVKQLTAAVMLHDIGMVFLPENLINKSQKYNSLEEMQVRQHAKWSYDWLRRIPNWDEASQMILQHHERPDGSGYPNGLAAEDIHDGAQIIALADTFYSITNQRSDRTYKKSLMRSITEINSYKGIQFKEHIVEAFNEWVRKIYTKIK